MTYDQALEQVRHAIYGKDVREAIAYLFANTKLADPTLDRYSANAIQNKAVWAEFQNAYLKIDRLGSTGVAGTVTIGLEDAAGDGITDDTDALNKALNHSTWKTCSSRMLHSGRDRRWL